METNKILQGDCLEVLKTLPENSVDSIVTDPPYELGFMNRAWDSTGIANNKDMWAECLRVLKPGGHLLAFSGTRTYHRMASAIEDAGFEVRDMIEWVYGSGFPKSLNIGKAVDKLLGAERETIKYPARPATSGTMSGSSDTRPWIEESRKKGYQEVAGNIPVTEESKQWEGWGTALKPAHEPICMARKPLAEKTVAENCLKYGTGGINIDESRVGTEKISVHGYQGQGVYGVGGKASYTTKENGADTRPTYTEATGRFPANLIHDGSDEVVACFPDAGKGNGKGAYNYAGREYDNKDTSMFNGDKPQAPSNFNDSGSAARFFKSILYYPKASKSERNKGCEGLEEKEATKFDGGDFQRGEGNNAKEQTHKNNHPTVKPIALMEYLIKMVTPKGGIVLDPFAGSGSTLVAAKQNGFQYIGIELTPEYIPIIEARLKSPISQKLF